MTPRVHNSLSSTMSAKPKPAAKKVAKFMPPLVIDPAPKQARVYPSLQAWLSQPANVIRLRQILADPVFVAACHYVEESVNVTPDELIGAHAALPEVVVRKAAMAAGVRIFATTLAAMPNFRTKDTAAAPEPWEHIQAPVR